MKFGFTVGEIEQHKMELSFDHVSGDLTVLMDGAQVLCDSPELNVEPAECYELSLRDGEKHKLIFQLMCAEELNGAGTLGVPRLMVMAIP